MAKWNRRWALTLIILSAWTVDGGVVAGTPWPMRAIPYEEPPAAFAIVGKAITIWNGTPNVPVTFRPKTDADQAFIRFAAFRSVRDCELEPNAAQPAGRANLGYLGKKPHYVCLAARANTRTVLHELGHAMGLDHEHQHCRRERFLKFDLSAVPENELEDYAAYSCIPFAQSWPFTRYIHLPRMVWTYGYDFRSVMHYRLTLPRLDKKWELTDPEGKNRIVEQGIEETEASTTVGNEETLSEGDLQALKMLYP